MAELFKPELSVLKPQWGDVVPANVEALFTLRTGGVSSGPWGGADGVMGLNLAEHTGDNARCVAMNRDILSQMLPSNPTWLKQVHSTTVLELHAGDPLVNPEADAVVTTEPNVVCAVMVADCVPVLFATKEGSVVGAAHAGWRGLCAGVLEATVKRIRALAPDTQGIYAWIGPHIGMDDFEVGDEVFEAFHAVDPTLTDNDGRFFKRSEVTGKLTCNLKALAVKRLHQVGLATNAIFSVDISTASDKERCYSYRRDGERSGRHAALIWKSA